MVPTINIDRYTSLNAVRYCFALSAMFGNGFIVFLVLKNRSLRKMHCNVLIAQLAVWEMLMGFGVFTRATYALQSVVVERVEFSKRVCAAVNAVIYVPMLMQHFSVISIALNQLLVVCFPLHHFNDYNWAHFVGLLVVELCVAIFATFCTFYRIDTSTTTPVCTMNASSGAYFTYNRAIANGTLLIMIVLYCVTLLTLACDRKYMKMRRTVQRRVTTGILLVLFNYTICWTIPPLMNVFAWAYSDMGLTITSSVVNGYLGGINATVSFCIYMLKHEEMRNCARRLFGGSASVSPPLPPETTLKDTRTTAVHRSASGFRRSGTVTE